MEGFIKTIYYNGSERLDERYKRIIKPHIKFIKDKTILDLGCYNGRWSYAALKNGAKYVIGVDGRNNIILKDDKFKFIQSDVFNINIEEKIDTIFCLGLFYHIIDHFRFFEIMDSFNPETIILDTHLINTDEHIIRIRKEDNNYELNSLIPLCGIASKGTLDYFCEYFDYNIKYIEWNGQVTKNTWDYFTNDKEKRYTILLRKNNV